MIFNMNTQKTSLCLVLIFTFFNSGCGYISDKPPADVSVFKAEQLQACKIDLDKLGEIFKENQEAQINCLKDNFIQYTKYVKTSSNDTVNESELSDFVKKIFQGQSDSVLKGLSVIFQLNMILLKDESQKISKGNITPLFELLVTANREAIIITESLKLMNKEENQDRFFEIREKFKASVTRFARATLKIMSTKNGSDQSLNIKTFILDASDKLGGKPIDPETIDTLICLKQILVAGPKEVITTKELESLINKLPNLLSLTFDLYYAQEKNFKSKSEEAKFYLDNTQSLNSLIEFNQPAANLITVDQILKFVQNNFKDKDLDVTKFKSSIIALKKKVIGGEESTFSLIDLKKMMNLALDFTERRYFNNLTYEIRRDFLESKEANGPITLGQLSPINVAEYKIFSLKRVNELTRNFNETLIKFRYFRDNFDGSSFYGTQFSRNRYGLIEVTDFKWLAKILLEAYGHLENNEKVVTISEFQVFLLDMKPILEELKLWSPNFETFARNAVLLADLFQNQSTGDLQMNTNETTEYLQMIFTATNLSDGIRKNLLKYCDPGINKDDPLYDVNCMNEHFYDLFLNELNFKQYFPRLLDYYKTTPKAESLAYLKGVEGFARDINDPKIPVNKRDAILIFGAMVNVETTFIRFDKNLDNIIDYDELMEAFKLYRNSIIELAKLKPEQESYAPSIFLYMVSKMEVPPTNDWIDNVKFYTFHKCVQSEKCRNNFLDKIEAKRLNIGSLLYYIVNGPSTSTVNKKLKLNN
jgi:hypothetical protein